ncbi:hypothetical protein EYF80_023317 [Liparis tanakae]|uniref:Uncharacterized protein n=1 Tax=Liparis tanakae TaxID=230148 RepID=A0A4Z2HLH7_9TELE|nr:hypothetical protein EYF80_023317 [Liparis tanakae]
MGRERHQRHHVGTLAGSGCGASGLHICRFHPDVCLAAVKVPGSFLVRLSVTVVFEEYEDICKIQLRSSSPPSVELHTAPSAPRNALMAAYLAAICDLAEDPSTSPSTSPSTVTRDSTPCWNNAHITTCITTHFSPSRHGGDSAVVRMSLATRSIATITTRSNTSWCSSSTSRPIASWAIPSWAIATGSSSPRNTSCTTCSCRENIEIYQHNYIKVFGFQILGPLVRNQFLSQHHLARNLLARHHLVQHHLVQNHLLLSQHHLARNLLARHHLVQHHLVQNHPLLSQHLLARNLLFQHHLVHNHPLLCQHRLVRSLLSNRCLHQYKECLNIACLIVLLV